MPDYKAMYFKLLCAHCDVLERLQQAGLETEEMAAGAKDPVVLADAVRKGDAETGECE